MRFLRTCATIPALALLLWGTGGCGFFTFSDLNQSRFPRDDQALSKATWFTDHIIVGYRDSTSLNAVAALLGGRVTQEITELRVATIELPASLSVPQALRKLNDTRPAGLHYAEPDYIRARVEPAKSHRRDSDRKLQTANTPKALDYNDPLQQRQYALDFMRARQAWKQATGQGVTIAVVDTGMDGTHPELKGKQVQGMSCLDGEPIEPETDGSQGSNSHGTHVAGIAAAKANNNEGIIGVAYDAKIMSLVIFDARRESDTNGSGYVGDANVARCLVWAATVGPDGIADSGDEASVFNNSWSDKGYSQVLKEAIDTVIESGAFFVAAMANSSEDEIRYPQSYPGVVGVGATDGRDQKADFSTMGRQISLSAPGDEILSSIPQWNIQPGTDEPLLYDYFDGTSMAAPQVAAAAALVKQKFPDATPYQIRKILERTAEDIESPGFEPRTGWGRLNLQRALETRALPGDGGAAIIKIFSENKADTDGDGKITASDDQIGIPAVDVTLRQGSLDKYFARTGGDGVAKFFAIDPGTYEVLIGGADATIYSYRVANRVTARSTLHVARAQKSEIKFTLNSTLKITLRWEGAGDLDLKINEPHEDGRQRWVSAKRDDFEERWGTFDRDDLASSAGAHSETYTLNPVHYPLATYEIGISGQHLGEPLSDVHVTIEQNGVRETYGPFTVKPGDLLPSYVWWQWWASKDDPDRGVFFGPGGPFVF